MFTEKNLQFVRQPTGRYLTVSLLASVGNVSCCTIHQRTRRIKKYIKKEHCKHKKHLSVVDTDKWRMTGDDGGRLAEGARCARLIFSLFFAQKKKPCNYLLRLAQAKLLGLQFSFCICSICKWCPAQVVFILLSLRMPFCWNYIKSSVVCFAAASGYERNVDYMFLQKACEWQLNNESTCSMLRLDRTESRKDCRSNGTSITYTVTAKKIVLGSLSGRVSQPLQRPFIYCWRNPPTRTHPRKWRLWASQKGTL